MKCGLELHMQLNTGKLFCNCPNLIVDDEKADFIIKRKLHAVKGETGKIDIAAKREVEKNKIIKYHINNKSSCLVDIDEEPPHSINMKAFNSALEMAILLNMKPVDEFHVMRKLIVDGSSPSGFQRTGLLATNGYIDTSLGKVRIDSLCLEEDSAKRIDDNSFSLDRLGIPLVEIATAPDIKTPEHAREVAEKIGSIAKFTKKLMRGIGTIRQDVNVSIPKGNRVEIKGMQDLRMMGKFVSLEVQRQENLLKLKEYLKKIKVKLTLPTDISKLFLKTKCNFLKNEQVFAFKLINGKGLFGTKIQLNKTFGKEVAEHIKVKTGLKGLLHIDELPNYGITQKEVEAISKKLSCSKKDGFILISTTKELVSLVYDIIVEELKEAKKGIRKEVRSPNHSNGTSAYMRPLPGKARMYPETDVTQKRLTNVMIENVISNLSKTPQQKFIELKSMGINTETINQLLHSDKLSLFEEVCDKTDYVNQLTANLILENNVDMLNKEIIIKLFKLLENEKISKTAFSQVVTELINGKNYDKVIRKYKLLTTKELDKEIDNMIKKNKSLLKNPKGFGIIMNKLLTKLKGKADAGTVSKVLKNKLGENF